LVAVLLDTKNVVFEAMLGGFPARLCKIRCIYGV